MSRHEDWEVDEYVERQQRARQRERLASGRYEWVEADDGLPGPILVEKRDTRAAGAQPAAWG